MAYAPTSIAFCRLPHLIVALGLLGLSPSLHADWRKDLLKERGIGLDEASLKKAAQQNALENKDLEAAFKALGSDAFAEREQAQRQLSEAGEAVLDFLETKEPIDDPEVRVRVADIRKAVSSGAKTRMGTIVRRAAKSLLEKAEDPETGGWFFEWFGTDKADCLGGYRELTHEGAKAQKPFVKDGRLYIPGKHAGEEDQRLSLHAKDWPGVETLPNRMELSCLLGGEAAGAGVWHVALVVGKIKVLFHPGYQGGGFRFEQVGTLEKFSNNQDMGFTPEFGKLYRMNLVVARFPSGRVGIKATVLSPDGKSFESHIQVEAEDVGPLDRISLERSGRMGGNAIFDDLHVKIRP